MAKQAEEKQETRYIVRIYNTDIDGKKPLAHALSQIKGVGPMMANMACNLLSMDKAKKVGELSDQEVETINAFFKDPLAKGAPVWMLNRRKDYETGQDMHLMTTDITLVQGDDVKRLRKIKTYRGIRHGLRLPLRGQRTKSNFRRNKGKVMGVARKK